MSLPTQFGSYTLERNLGKGGSSEVWLARHSYLKEYCVAIKVLMSQDAETVRRFQREAVIAARLRHPNIVQLYDFGYSQPFYYAVLEYVEGASLREILTHRKHLPLPEALALLAQIASALDYAHSLSIVHRDVTPANILVAEPTRRALLTDFGIARGPGAPITEFNSVMGTKGYLSPEASQSAMHATHRSDIFSLGVVLYELLSGKLPWNTLPREGDLAAFADLIPLYKQDVTGLPSEVDRVLAKMLAVNPAERYPTAGAAIDDLRRILARHENTTQALSSRRINSVHPVTLQASGVTPNEVEQLLSPDLAGPVIARAHRRADELQNPETLTTLLDAWAAASPFRRPLLGRLARFHKITSHNVYFYRLQVLYEQRGSPELIEEPDRTAEVFELEPELEPWAVPLPPPKRFADDPGGTVRLPGSTRVAACPNCQGRGATPCPTCRGRQRVIEHRPVPPSPAQVTVAPAPTTLAGRRPTLSAESNDEAVQEQPKTQPVLVPCGTCAGRGGVSCERCDGIGRLVQRKIISWSRHPQLFQAHDDLPALDENWLARTCEAERVYHEQHIGGLRPEWAMVGTLNDLTRSAEAAQGDRRIVLSELTIDLIPVTEIIFDLGKTGEGDLYKLAIFGFKNLIPPDWRFFNWERVGAMVAVGFMAMLVVVLLAFHFLG